MSDKYICNYCDKNEAKDGYDWCALCIAKYSGKHNED